MKLIAALAALVPPAKSKNDELWPYKVVELKSSGYGDKPIVTCEYFVDSYEKAYHTMCQHANDSYKNSLSSMSLDFRPRYTVKAFASGIRCSITGRNVLFQDAGHQDISL